MLSIKNFLNSLIMKKYKYLITFVFLCFLGNSHARDSNLFELYVLDVVDGDTIKVKFENKIKKIRLSAIDAPEMKQSSGKESKKFLSDLIKKKKIKFHKLGTDRYGRLLGIIFYNDKDVNLEMIINGHAWVYRKYLRTIPKKYRNLYKNAEEEAKNRKIGLFKNIDAQPPWVWRSSN